MSVSNKIVHLELWVGAQQYTEEICWFGDYVREISAKKMLTRRVDAKALVTCLVCIRSLAEMKP